MVVITAKLQSETSETFFCAGQRIIKNDKERLKHVSEALKFREK